MTSFLRAWSSYKGHLVPKCHMCWHLAEQCAEMGNPAACWAYPDENENRLMGTVAKSLRGGSTFYVRFLEEVVP
eukprot:3168363-Pyramimonas_sp.AAC.1